MRRASRHGFTLIELLIVIALLAVALGLGTTTLIKTIDLYATIKGSADLDTRAQEIFNRIGEDVASAVDSRLAGMALVGTAGETRDTALFYNQNLANDHFVMPVRLPVAGGGTNVVLVGYQLDRDAEGALVLVRTTQALRGGEPAKLTVATGVLQMRIEYQDGAGAWTGAWAQPANPKAIRVSVTLGDPRNPAQFQIARKAVIQVHVS